MVGVDEVGRGALAGPLLVVAARQLGDTPKGLADSKLLSRSQREKLYASLIPNFEFGEGWVSPREIDRFGIGAGLRLGVKRALSKLMVGPSEEIVLDGITNYTPKRYKLTRCEAKADMNYPVVSAASVYAKVTRDRLMADLSTRHTKFTFSSHVGYGTRQHYKEIRQFGPLKHIHRYSFEPIRQIMLP